MKKDIADYLHDRGADLVGFASAEQWVHDGRVGDAYRPGSIWPPVRSVIVIGLQMPLPIVETTPSVQHRDLYTTCNRRLDDLAFDLTRRLNRQDHAAIPLSRDGYANIHVLIRKPAAAFSHTFSAYYAGLGNIGVNNTILTHAFGPRVRFVSVFTDAPLPAEAAPPERLCIRCGACVRLCPVQALQISKIDLTDPDIPVATYHRRACAQWARALTERGCYPCGICIKVCPVGEDRKLYDREKTLRHYAKETEAPLDTDDPYYRGWAHIRAHGSGIPDQDALSLADLREAAEKIKKENNTAS
ncbi:MAG: epoxyqueuosine reductase [Syntrophus sp. (in: bacteria)]|nr:epoxyqueuosine reductase [Syntrophus sp. (in: bacteria)]